MGREREGAAVRGLLRGDGPPGGGARLVTLTGPGGHGQDAPGPARRRRGRGGLPGTGCAWWSWPPWPTPALVPRAVAAALGLREAPGQDVTETLLQTLREQRLLLVLDNCEHLLPACAALAETLLRGCPGLQVLATSRQGLGVLGETTWPVPALGVPATAALPLAQLAQSEAVRLFVERAASVAPGFALTERNAAAVAEVCRRLDGLPLALELAAARVRTLSVEQIAARLDRRLRLLTSGSRAALPHQQTLRASMDWSYDLLAAPERQLLRPPLGLRRGLDAGGGGGRLRRRAPGAQRKAGSRRTSWTCWLAWWTSRWWWPARWSQGRTGEQRSGRGATPCRRRCASTPWRSCSPRGRRSPPRPATRPTT